MRPFTHTIPFDEALRLALDAAVPIARTETLPLVDADGRVAARDVVAAVDVPPFDRAAMDGYAVIAADTAGTSQDSPREQACIGVAFAGQPLQTRIRFGQCVEIATGAPLPPGADAVVMVERTARNGELVWIQAEVTPGQNVGRRGDDLSAGDTVVRSGQLLTPARLGALAATGVGRVEVFARPSVALASTGNEVVEPGTPLKPGQIHDINRFTLTTIVERHGGTATSLPITGDSMDDLRKLVERARTRDIIVLSGGSSVGDRDFVLDVLQEQGTVIFHGISVKPGKPTAFGRIGDTPIFGMPGNPTSCLSNGYILLVPFLRKVARLPAWKPCVVELPVARDIKSTADRHQFFTVRIENGHVEPAFKGSSAITSMAGADGYIEIPAGTDLIEAGSVVRVTLL